MSAETWYEAVPGDMRCSFFAWVGWLVFVEGDLFTVYTRKSPLNHHLGEHFLFFQNAGCMTHPWAFDKPVLGEADFLNRPSNG